MIRSALLGLLLACTYLTWQFGPDAMRYHAMVTALERLEHCEGDDSCEEAWEEVQRVKKGKE